MSKSCIVDSSVELKSTKVKTLIDAKPNIGEAFVHVEASLVDSGVFQLGDNEVDTTPFFLFRTGPRPNLIRFSSDPSPISR